MCSTSAQYALSHYAHPAFAASPYGPAAALGYAAAYPGYAAYHGW